MDSTEFLLLLPTWKKKLSRIVKLTILRKNTHVASELFFFYVELWAENTNAQQRHTPFAISKIKFSETLRRKSSTSLLRLMGRTDSGRSLFVVSNVFWSSSFWDIYCDIYRPQRTKLMLPG